jgi:3'(2'), 5'-bisphosphate nucleotidase
MATFPRALLDGPLSQVLRAVDQAAQLTRWIRQHDLVALTKHDRTPLTVADLAVQAVIVHALERSFPGDPLVAEEDASTLETDAGRSLAEPLLHFVKPFLPGLGASELGRLLSRGGGPRGPRFWALDPVDGTEGFLRDNGHFVVALTLIEAGSPTLGILGCPTVNVGGLAPRREGERYGLHGSLLVAQRGQGAWVSPLEIVEFAPVRVSGVTTLRDAQALGSVVDSHVDVALTQAFVRAAELERTPLLVDGQAKHALIAAGHADFLARIPADPGYREHIWDHAAGALAIEEAGGRVTDLNGQPLDFSTGSRLTRNEGVAASNGHLHDAVIAALRAARRARSDAKRNPPGPRHPE